MATIITALIVIGALALIIGLLVWVHNRDNKESKEVKGSN
jgi:hypothetical protein